MNSFNYRHKDPPGGFGGNIIHLVIPLEMIAYALRNKLIRPLQLYILLKYNCSGKTKLNKQDKPDLAKWLDYKSTRTINNNLVKLQAMNWIGYNPKSKVYFIRSFERIRIMMGFIRRTGVCYCFTDWKMNEFKGFCIAAVLGNLINYQKREKWMIERESGRSRQIIHNPSSDLFPVSNSALAKILNVSLSIAFRYKQLAKQVHGIHILKSWQSVPKWTYYNLRKYNMIRELRVLNKRKNVLIQSTDMIQHNLRFKMRKKIETY